MGDFSEPFQSPGRAGGALHRRRQVRRLAISAGRKSGPTTTAYHPEADVSGRVAGCLRLTRKRHCLVLGLRYSDDEFRLYTR